MTQTMDEFEKLLNEQFSYTFNVADIIQGVVVKRDKNGFLVDIGAKSEAFLPDKEITANGEKPSEFLADFPVSANVAYMKDAANSEDTEDLCPKCKTGHLVRRKNEKTGTLFIGCSNYPK